MQVEVLEGEGGGGGGGKALMAWPLEEEFFLRLLLGPSPVCQYFIPTSRHQEPTVPIIITGGGRTILLFFISFPLFCNHADLGHETWKKS